MTNNKILYIVIAVLVLAIIGGGLFFLGNKGPIEKAQAPATNGEEAIEPVVAAPVDKTMADCGEAKDPGCFMNRMSGCLPVTAKMIGSDGVTAIEITILGIENEKCHFQRKINNAMDLNCYFSKGTLNSDTLGQMFGDDKGLQKVVDDACSPAGW